MAASSFEYPSLNKTKLQIRLLQILPQRDSSFQYSLTTFDISTCPDYIALSYVWGDEEPTKTISINGQDFNIRDNLSHALPHLAVLRKRRDEQYFWIDAICINQEDTKERNHQVGIMKGIFTRATLTAAWLGLDIETFQLLSQVAINPCPSAWHGEFLRKMARNDYFQRMWIVQEFILSRDIWFLCRSAICSWKNLKHTLAFFGPGRSLRTWTLDGLAAASRASYREVVDRYRSLGSLATIMWWREAYHDDGKMLHHHFQLSKLLNSFLDQRCSDPRDRIFSLLGLLPAAVLESSPIPVDYDISFDDLFSLGHKHLLECSSKLSEAEIELWGMKARYLRLALNLDD